MKRYSAATEALFVSHYASTSPEDFRAILAAAGVAITDDAIYRLAGRLGLSKIAPRRGPGAGVRVGDWEDQVRDASMFFAGLPGQQHTRGGPE
jgi:hypothetical protein